MRIQSTVGGASLALAAAILASARPQPLAGQTLTPAPATFSGDIRAILQAHCTICHSPGGPSPMPLVTYEDVLPWAEQIKEQSLTRRMPIWHAARGYGEFSNDPTLTPYEFERIVSWVDGGRNQGPPVGDALPSPGAANAVIAAGAQTAELRLRSTWITGWTFVPGDPLITSATFTSADGSTIGAWTAGDRAARLPHGSAIHVVSPVRVDIRRRDKTPHETPFTPKPSSLLFFRLAAPASTSSPASAPPPSRGASSSPAPPASPPSSTTPPPVTPARRVRIERVSCGGSIGPADASLIGVRPLLAAGASAQVTVERLGGAQAALLGWFRNFDPNYARIYWLDHPLDFVAGARLTSDAPCELDLVLSSPAIVLNDRTK